MTVTVYVPCDTTALSLGADRVAQELLNAAATLNLDIHLVRNGSRGLFWLEPLVEVQTPYGRMAYGPVEPGQVNELVAAGLFEGQPDHPIWGISRNIPTFSNSSALPLPESALPTLSVLKTTLPTVALQG